MRAREREGEMKSVCIVSCGCSNSQGGAPKPRPRDLPSNISRDVSFNFLSCPLFVFHFLCIYIVSPYRYAINIRYLTFIITDF